VSPERTLHQNQHNNHWKGKAPSGESRARYGICESERQADGKCGAVKRRAPCRAEGIRVPIASPTIPRGRTSTMPRITFATPSTSTHPRIYAGSFEQNPARSGLERTALGCLRIEHSSFSLGRARCRLNYCTDSVKTAGLDIPEPVAVMFTVAADGERV
jgi:hypothetical protein